jgi:DNA mismatch endonuclease, patch repair protein
MSCNRATDTAPEVTLRRALWRRGLRYRLRSRLPGKPDLVFLKQKLAVFVDGCFWHGCPIHSTLPNTNRKFWAAKFEANRARDELVNRTLKGLGWEPVRIWEHEIRLNAAAVSDFLERLIESCDLKK